MDTRKRTDADINAQRIAEAKQFGFDLNIETNEYSAYCNRCGTYAVLPGSGCLCVSCIDVLNSEQGDCYGYTHYIYRLDFYENRKVVQSLHFATTELAMDEYQQQVRTGQNSNNMTISAVWVMSE